MALFHDKIQLLIQKSLPKSFSSQISFLKYNFYQKTENHVSFKRLCKLALKKCSRKKNKFFANFPICENKQDLVGRDAIKLVTIIMIIPNAKFSAWHFRFWKMSNRRKFEIFVGFFKFPISRAGVTLRLLATEKETTRKRLIQNFSFFPKQQQLTLGPFPLIITCKY